MSKSDGGKDNLDPKVVFQIERAWQYAWSADDMTHSRMSGLLISQAFLVVGYFQILTADQYAPGNWLFAVALALVLLALLITYTISVSVRHVARGCESMKHNYLCQLDDVYLQYLADVRRQPKEVVLGWVQGNSSIPRKKGMFSSLHSYTESVPALFILFWIVVLIIQIWPWLRPGLISIFNGAPA